VYVKTGQGKSIIIFSEGYSRRVVDSIIDYVQRVKANPLAAKVKLEDLRHNSDPGRLASLSPDAALHMKNKYYKAMRILEEKN
jgi:hypothetical protein